MSLVNEVRVLWEGLPGLPGTNTFHLDPSETSTAQLLAFYVAVADLIPTGCVITVPGSGSTINVETGELEGVWSAATGGTTNGTNNAAYAGGVGVTVRWNTASIVGGHRVKGHTFLVPMVSGVFDVDGTVASGSQATIADAANVVVDHYDGLLRVWHRPKAGAGGSLHTVTSAAVPDRAAWLKTRRA